MPMVILPAMSMASAAFMTLFNCSRSLQTHWDLYTKQVWKERAKGKGVWVWIMIEWCEGQWQMTKQQHSCLLLLSCSREVSCAPYFSSYLLRSRYVPGTRIRSAYQAIEDLKIYCLIYWAASETKQLLRTKGLTVFIITQIIDIYFWTLASSEKLWKLFSWKQLQAGSALSSLCKNI